MASRTILNAVDFDENSLATLRTSANLAAQTGATVKVMHVLQPLSPTRTSRELEENLSREQILRERLASICKERMAGTSHEVLTRIGDPAICITRAAEELRADFIVIATHSSRSMPRAFAGSVAERVIRESCCPVITVRPTSSGDPDSVGVHMTAAPVTIPIDATVARVTRLIAEQHVRWFPVVEGAKVAGIITDRDIGASEATADTPVAALMSRDVVSVSPTTSLQEAARRLVECEMEGLPVIEGSRLAGIITRSDILRVFSEIAPPRPRSTRMRSKKTGVV